jgi:outer membrane porin, OprD family
MAPVAANPTAPQPEPVVSAVYRLRLGRWSLSWGGRASRPEIADRRVSQFHEVERLRDWHQACLASGVREDVKGDRPMKRSKLTGEGYRPRRDWARTVLFVGVMLLTCLGGPPRSRADEDQPRPTAVGRLFPGLREAVKDFPAFLRDTDITLYLRTYYFGRENPDGSENEALAFGGWFTYRSGWLLDTLQLGATGYGSAPLYAPDDRDGTTLLKPGQEGYGVLGEAFAALRYQDLVLIKGYRQEVTQGYINREDNRMTPNTFEGLTLGGKVGPVDYLGGYLWKMKARNSDTFRFMSEEAGVAGSDDGVALFGVKLAPLPGLKLDVSEQYGFNTFNTVFAQADYTHPLAEDLRLIFGGQFTDQRAVGDQLLTTASSKDWDTYNVSAKAAVGYRELTVTVGGSVTGSGHTIQAPWGSFPGYLSLIQEDFQRADEKAVLVGAAYDFSKLITPGLGAFFNIAWGWDAIDPKTRAAAPDQTEYDLTIDYRPPRGFLLLPVTRNLWLRLRGAILDREDSDQLGYQVRLILNWEIPFL